MGWLQNIFKKAKANPSANYNQQVSMKGYEPVFSSFGDTILYNNLILKSIQKKMRYFGKQIPHHIREREGKSEIIKNSSVAKLLRRPNDFSTIYDFLTQAYFIREKDNNCFIYPDYIEDSEGVKTYIGLYILLPITTPIITQDQEGTLYINFEFINPSRVVQFKYSDIIVWKQNMEDNQFLGGGQFDAMSDKDILNSIKVYHTSKEAVAEAAKLGCYFDGILKINGYAQTNEAIEKIRNDFIKSMKNNKSGIPVLDNGADYINIQRQLKMVDSATLSEIKNNIVIHTGMTLDMIMGKMTPDEERSFYEDHIEPAAISLEQAMSKVFFTEKQESYGDKIKIYPQEIDRMTATSKLKLAELFLTSGAGTYDEIRHLFGYAPLPKGEGNLRPRAYNSLDGLTPITTKQEEEEAKEKIKQQEEEGGNKE